MAGHGKLAGLTDTPKDIALGDTAGVAFLSSRPKRCKLVRWRTLVTEAAGSAHSFAKCTNEWGTQHPAATP